MGLLLAFVVLGALVTAPLHFFGWRSALKLCACAVCGFSIFGQLNPDGSDARVLAGLGAALFIVGFAVSSVFRGGLSSVLLLSGGERPDPGGTRELPGWAGLAAGLFISAACTFLFFVALSWVMQSSSFPMLMHLCLAVLGAILVWVCWSLDWLEPTEVDGLRQTCLGCGLALSLLTSYSWLFYPSTVEAGVRDAVGDASFCLWNSDKRKVAESWRAFTFLTSPKRESNSHFLLVSDGGQIFEWSYRRLGFVHYATDEGATWFNAVCSNAADLNAGQ